MRASIATALHGASAPQPENDNYAWLTWFADIVIESKAQTITRIHFLIDKRRMDSRED